MTADALLNIVLSVVVPGLMALIGGILAARSLPSESGKRNPEMWIWTGGFLFLFLVSIILAFVQQIRSTAQDRVRESIAYQEKLSTHGEVKFMQGQLDSINKVLATLSSNSNPSQTAAILKSLITGMPQVIGPGQSALEKMSNKQLRFRVLEFVSRLRDSIAKYNQQEQQSSNQWQMEITKLARTDTASQNESFQRMTQRELALSNQFQADYKSLFAADALSYRDELIRRLGPQLPSNTGMHVPLSLDGWIAPMSVDATATFLETLAKKFPD